jgi:hypothetical protein
VARGRSVDCKSRRFENILGRRPSVRLVVMASLTCEKIVVIILLQLDAFSLTYCFFLLLFGACALWNGVGDSFCVSSIMDEFILQDMPDLRRFSEAAKTSQNVLMKLESILKMIDPRETDLEDELDANASDSENASIVTGHSRNVQTTDRPGAEPARANASSTRSPARHADSASSGPSKSVQYFELDEEWDGHTRSGTSESRNKIELP